MLCATRKSDGQPALAFSESKLNAPFLCPECRAEVVLRAGTVRVSHFAHKPPITCSYGGGETEAHRRCKMEIYQALLRQPGVTKVALERPLGSVRPDISAYINGVPVAIEVQISTLSQEAIIHRTQEYERKGIYVLWLPQWSPYLDGQRYSPRLWEKWVHAAYFGQVYYWIEELTVASYHFDQHHLHVPETSWYSERGQEMSAGGYSRKSKRWREPLRLETLNLGTDFVPRTREYWKGGKIEVPVAKLYVGRREDSGNSMRSKTRP
jgi:competence protein CoiA